MKSLRIDLFQASHRSVGDTRIEDRHFRGQQLIERAGNNSLIDDGPSLGEPQDWQVSPAVHDEASLVLFNHRVFEQF